MATAKKAAANASEPKPRTTRKPRETKPKAVRSTEIEKELEALKKSTAELHEENVRMAEQYGKLLEFSTNMKIKANAMLGQVLKGLYLLGIGPDEIIAKCNQMFRKKVVAD